jgi:RimJ/RimL family protein N-acetyltransferase
VNGLLIGSDEAVAAWTFSTFNLTPMLVNKAIGIVNDKGQIIGAALFQDFNGYNVELGYYGPKTVSLGISRALARMALCIFNVSRVTVVTSKKNKKLMRGLLKFGFKLEGAQRCYYGQEDINRNTGVRFVMFRTRLQEIASGTYKKAIRNAL